MNLADLSKQAQRLAKKTTEFETIHGDDVNNQDEYRATKKKYYETKMQMIDLMSAAGVDKVQVTARELRDKIKSKPKPPKYETGVYALDSALNGGIELGSLVLLAGQSFVGKTHLTIEILSNVCRYKPAVFYNFEMGDYRIVDKLDSLFINHSQWDNLIINSEDRELYRLSADINLQAKQGIKYFAIDSRMKIEVSGNDPEYMKIASITKELSKVAQKNDIIIFLINQMSNESIKDSRLTFKGSGDALYDTDLAFFYLKNDETGERVLKCNKNRQADGNEFTLKLRLSNKGRTLGSQEVEMPTDEPSRKVEMAANIA